MVWITFVCYIIELYPFNLCSWIFVLNHLQASGYNIIIDICYR